MPIYLDCAATTPVDPRVRAEMLRFLDDDFGNAGSRTHAWGRRARAAVEGARDRIAAAVAARRGDVIFTSGGTESNNLAILGLASPGRVGHIVSTAIEHHAVLEPLAELRRRGYEVTLISADQSGAVEAEAVAAAVRPDTRLVSVMHVNNETGIAQPIAAIAERLADHPACLHVDAAQSFAREIDALRHPRINLISASAHKINGPQGVGALIARRRGQVHPPLGPLMFGGGQERGLRPGTIPVHLVAGFGLAAELAIAEREERAARCARFRQSLMSGLAPLDPVVNGDPSRAVSYIVNLAFPGIEAEVVFDAWSELAGVSNGAACTSESSTCSHVLGAMKLPAWRMDGAVRLSWCASTPEPDWTAMVQALEPHAPRLRTPAPTTP